MTSSIPPMNIPQRFFLVHLFAAAGLVAHAQCTDVGVSVSASDSGLIQLYHPGFFLFGATPNVGGFDNVCYWTIYDMDDNIVHEAETSGEWSEQSFLLFEHDLAVTDSMRVELVLTSPLEEADCCVSDTLLWEETQSPLGKSVWGDWSTETDGYTSGVECSTNSVHSEPETASLQLIPQPASEAFHIEGLHGGETITILSATGLEVFAFYVESPRQTFDIGEWPEGVYLVKVMSKASNQVQIRRLLKAASR